MIWLYFRRELCNLQKSTMPRKQRAAFSTQVLEGTTTSKDVILFKYENPRFYKYLNAFGMVQFFFWCYIGHSSIRSLRDAPPPSDRPLSDETPWWKKINLGEGKYKNTLAGVCYFFGFSILACSWVYTLRSVRYLVLNKGGRKVSLVTYTPFGENRIVTVPLEKMSCTMSRSGTKFTLPVKVYGHRFHYLLDMGGQFRHAELFDRTAGLYRKF